MRAHPAVGDALIALFVLVPDLADAIYTDTRPQPLWLAVPAGLLLAGPLFVRRRWPVPAAYVTLAGLLLVVITADTPQVRFGGIAVCIAVYTLVAYVGRRVAALYTALAAALVAYQVLVKSPHFEGRAGAIVVLAIVYSLVTAFCWALGEFVGARRAYHAEVERRLRNLEFEQDQQARIAVAEERNRIARELHDVLAHSVSVMITQADGGSYALRNKPELAEQALRTIGDTGRAALGELRGLLEVLRNPDEDGTRAPQPTATSLRELVDRVRELRLPTELELVGDFDELPTGIGLGVYRIVQESLTNVLKHGGRNVRARVRAVNDGERIDIEIVDDGSKTEPSTLPGGNGLIGMRERATIYGGTLDAGPRPEGGWRVHAVLPLPRG
ncbi:sensor histidine kinase [Saccharopolyspora taberi]|uniref:histidine kinase n=1 Tax=Saccharopolyspora taberi TaxID=60895 RepID=A0ABN3VML4_9PSEU